MNNEITSIIDPVGLHTLQLIAKAGRFNRWMYAEFNSFLKGDILEIGSGIGNISELVIKDGLKITLSDYNVEYCDFLTKKFSGINNVKGICQINLLHPDFNLQYANLKNQFDTVFLLNVIEHLTDDSKAVSNCRYMIKPGGHLIILAPAHQWLYCRLDKELGHHRRYTLKKMSSVLKKAGFTLLNKKYFNALGMLGWFISGKILSSKKLGGNEMTAFNNFVPIAKLLDRMVFKKTGLSVIGIGIKKEL